LLLLPPQLPNTVALNAAIATAVSIAHFFDTATKQGLHGQWQWKRWLWQRGWRVSNGDNGNCNGNNMRDGDGNKVTGNKEGDGKSGKSNDDSNKEGNAMAARAMATATTRAMVTDGEGNGDNGKSIGDDKE
jgi:hypothetical protein